MDFFQVQTSELKRKDIYFERKRLYLPLRSSIKSPRKQFSQSILSVKVENFQTNKIMAILTPKPFITLK